jgi:hypothetical protein
MAKTPVTAIDLVMPNQPADTMQRAGFNAIEAINRGNGIMSPSALKKAAETLDETKPWLPIKAMHTEVSNYLLRFNHIITLVSDKTLIPFIANQKDYLNNVVAFEEDYRRITTQLSVLTLQHQHLTVDSPIGDNYFLPITLGQGYQELVLDTQSCLVPVAAELEQIMVDAWNARAAGSAASSDFVIEGNTVTTAPKVIDAVDLNDSVEPVVQPDTIV